MENSFLTDPGVGGGHGSGSNAGDGKWQIKLFSLAYHSPPTLQPSSSQAMDWEQSPAQGLGTLHLDNINYFI